MRFTAYSAESGGGAGKADIKKAVKRLKCLAFSARQDPQSFRLKIDKEFISPHVPAKVECHQQNIGGIYCDIHTPEVLIPNRTIIYIHGGCFVGGSRKAWRSFCASLAAESSTQLILPEYRLAPQHPYPAALEDIQIVFREIYTKLDTARSPAPQIILIADGSGASIALALLQTLRDHFRHAIGNMVLFSPWLDMHPQSRFLSQVRKSDQVLTMDTIIHSAQHYTSRDNLSNSLISPLYIDPDKIQDFPPIYIQCGENEVNLRSVEFFQKKLQLRNHRCILDIWPGMMFMFQMAHEYLPQAHLAVQRVGSYIQNFNKTEETE